MDCHDKCDPAFAAHHPAAGRLQRFHDHGVVLAPALSRAAPVAGHSGELGHRVRRILPGVPANRYGSYVYSAAELKTIQEVITLVVFGVFSVTYLQQAITWNHVVGFALIAGGAFFVFRAPI